MAVLTYAELERAWIQAGGSRALAPVMAAIALAESGGRTNALNPNDNGGTQSSFGLWQISNGTHTPPSANWADPVENARLAVAKIKSQGLGAWGTYDSGAYRQFLRGGISPSTAAALSAASKGSGGGGGGGGLLSEIEHIPGLGDIVKLTGAAAGVSDIGNAIKAISNNFGQFLAGLSWLFDPVHWFRIVAFAAGVLLATGGVTLMVKAA